MDEVDEKVSSLKMNDDLSVAEYIASFFAERKVPGIFQLSGGMIAFITDAVHRLGLTPLINVRHEQTAGFAAEGASRISGIPAVALATSGPGATNLMTAIGSAYFDSTPTIFITGQVNQKELRLDPDQRQNGFQELDIVRLVKGVTKYAVQVKSAEELIKELDRAWSISLAGRPGPVLIDIPIDVQQLRISNSQVTASRGSAVPYEHNPVVSIDQIVRRFAASKYPLFLVGGGVRISGEVSRFRGIAERAGIPVVFSLMGADALPSNSPLRVGMIGSYGNRWANRALARADTLLVLGSRLDVRQTGNSVSEFRNGKTIIRVDIDQLELDGRIKADVNLRMSLTDFFDLAEVQNIESASSKDFLSLIKEWEAEFPPENEQHAQLDMNPNSLMEWIGEVFSTVDGYVVDVGQHQMWAAQSLVLSPTQRFITSGGMGAMGFAVPAAIGASTAKSGSWVVIAGDGCTQLSISELQTLKQYQFPIAICVINNEQHGMVAQFQEENMNSRFVGTRDGYSTPDFVRVAESFGIPAIRISTSGDLPKARGFISSWSQGPLLVEIKVSGEAKALPKLGRNSNLADL